MQASRAKTTSKIVILGYGTIAQAALPILLETTGCAAAHILVIDQSPEPKQLSPYLAQGLRYERQQLTPDNLARVVARATAAGDLLINLSVGVDSITVADLCHRAGVLYLDTAIEPWEGFVEDESLSTAARTEYALKAGKP